MWICKECGMEDIRLRKTTVEFWDCCEDGKEDDFIFDNYEETYICRNCGIQSEDVETIGRWKKW